MIFDLDRPSIKRQIKQQEVYEDLSESLVIIKKKMRLFLQKHEEDNIITNQTEHSDKQDKTAIRFDELINKYKQVEISTAEFISITKRFILRVRELIGQIINCISKNEVHLLLKIKRIELFISKCVNKDNYGLTIASLLQFVNKITNQSLPSYHFAHSRHALISDERLPLTSHFHSTPPPSADQSPTKKEISEVKMMLKQAQKYSKVMDLDSQYFRGRYFDLKLSTQEAMLNQILHRNRYIKSVMANYERDHIKYATKDASRQYENEEKMRVQRKEQRIKEGQKSRLTVADFTQDRTLRNFRAKSKQNALNKTFMVNDQLFINQGEIESFRHFYEQKINEKKNMPIKINNMVLPEPTKNVQIKNSNAKKLQFCKKSQEHERFRYKYYIRKETKCNNFVKGKTVNPEIICNSVDSK